MKAGGMSNNEPGIRSDGVRDSAGIGVLWAYDGTGGSVASTAAIKSGVFIWPAALVGKGGIFLSILGCQS